VCGSGVDEEEEEVVVVVVVVVAVAVVVMIVIVFMAVAIIVGVHVMGLIELPTSKSNIHLSACVLIKAMWTPYLVLIVTTQMFLYFIITMPVKTPVIHPHAAGFVDSIYVRHCTFYVPTFFHPQNMAVWCLSSSL
jgi:hypothetical protein